MNRKTKKYKSVKRILDIIFSLFGLIFLFIPLLILGIIIKITSRGPIIYWTVRPGLNNNCFRMAKLRTMKINTPIITESKLDRPVDYYLNIGKFLRKYGIDELPQLYNILIGDMSFVGPRPVLICDKELIEERINRRISIIKPGLTGLAQINGRSELSAFEKAEYDEYYMKNMSFVLDIKIIIKTIYFLVNSIFNKNYQKNLKTANDSVKLF